MLSSKTNKILPKNSKILIIQYFLPALQKQLFANVFDAGSIPKGYHLSKLVQFVAWVTLPAPNKILPPTCNTNKFGLLSHHNACQEEFCKLNPLVDSRNKWRGVTSENRYLSVIKHHIHFPRYESTNYMVQIVWLRSNSPNHQLHSVYSSTDEVSGCIKIKEANNNNYYY